MATKTLYLQHEYQHEGWGQQSWHKLHQQAQWRKPRHAQAAPVSMARRARSLRCTPLVGIWCNKKTAIVSMLSRLMTEQGDLLLIQLLKYVMKPIRSPLMMKYFVKEWRNPLLIMTRIMNRWWWTRQTWTSEFQDCHILLWNTRNVPAFENWFRKLRTTQIDTLFNKIYDRINHLTFSDQSQHKWFGMLETSNYVNYSRRNPERSAKYVYHTGTLASSIARADTSCVKEDERISDSSSIRWTFFQSLSMSSRKDDLTDIDLL